MKKIAVITDAVSSQYFFPIWHRYYGTQFGFEALNVVTYRSHAPALHPFVVGKTIVFEEAYNEERRAAMISQCVDELLQVNDVVIRCDVDEFLVPAPTGQSLYDYVSNLDKDYVTAIGLDVIELPDDSALDFDKPVLPQRPWCVETTSLSKTSIMTKNVRSPKWAAGFHAANLEPNFNDIYLLHTKFADVQGRVAWFSNMCEKLEKGTAAYRYYDNGSSKIKGFAAHLASLPRCPDVKLLDPSPFRERFLASVTRNEVNGIWQGDFTVDNRLLRHGVSGF